MDCNIWMCPECKTEPIKEVRGEYVCVACGLTPNERPLHADFTYTEADAVYYGGNGRCAEMVEPLTAHKKKINARTNQYRQAVEDRLRLLKGPADDMEELYTKYLATGVKPSEKRHMCIMGVCAYIASEAREARQVCKELCLDPHEFHATYNAVAKKIQIRRNEMKEEECIAAVRNKLMLTGIKSMDFRKACLYIYDRACMVPTGKSQLKQSMTTKVFAVIGMLALRRMKEHIPEEELLSTLDISKPTVKKIKGNIVKLLQEAQNLTSS
jgi:transcription initiation factor TFIIIB Brf1 subunit/transcription initiation factor TFIIB